MSGQHLKWYGTNVDIEDRKRVEEALLASELSLAAIVDNIPGLVADDGRGGEVEFLNRQVLEYFGRTKDDLKTGPSSGPFIPTIFLGSSRARAKSIETGQLYEVEHRCRGADGVYTNVPSAGLRAKAEGQDCLVSILTTSDEDGGGRGRAQPTRLAEPTAEQDGQLHHDL